MQEKRYLKWQSKGALTVIHGLEKAAKLQVSMDAEIAKGAGPVELANLIVGQMQVAENITEVTAAEVDGYEFLSAYIPGCRITQMEERIR